jgi:PAS domain S-box-containing protein
MENLHILIVEDQAYDAELIAHQLKRSDIEFDWSRVDNEMDYISSLDPSPDLIIADYNLPRFDALRALTILKQRGLDIPLVVVTGSISEEVAVEMMKQGAADYLLKDRLTRLGQAITNAMKQKKERDDRQTAQLALRESEERFRRIAENAQDVIFRYRLIPKRSFEYMSPAIESMTGFTPEELYSNPDILQKIFSGLSAESLKTVPLQDLIQQPFILEGTRKDGKLLIAEHRISAVKDENGRIVALDGISRDVTDRIQKQRELETIVSVSNALRIADSRTSLISIVLEQLIRLFKVDGTGIAMIESSSGDAVIEGARGLLIDFEGTRIPAGKGLTGYVIQTGETYVTMDFNRDPHVFKLISSKNRVSLASVPLINQGVIIGTLNVAKEKPLGESEVRLLIAVADVAANAIQRETLHEKAVQHAHAMSIVGEIGRILAESLNLNTIFTKLDHYIHDLLPDSAMVIISYYDSAAQQFTCQHANINGVLLDPAELPPVPLEPQGNGTQSEVIHTRQPIIINRLRDRLNKVSKVINVGDEADGVSTQSGLFVPMLAHDVIIGVVQVQSYTIDRYTKEDAEALSLVANTAAIIIENLRLFTDLQRSNKELLNAYDSTLEGWSRALDLRDNETEGHTLRVAELTRRMAMRIGIDGSRIKDIQRGSLLHDIGKVGIPDQILLKPGPLTDEEWKIMRRHPDYAYQLIQPIEYLRNALEIPYCHHEKWDGTGYPRGLKGEEIPLSARIFALTDVWDALSSDRPYRKAWNKADVRAYIQSQSGAYFDPNLVPVFLELIDEEE